MGLKPRAKPGRQLPAIVDELRQLWTRIYDEASSFDPMKPVLLEAIDATADADQLRAVLCEEPFDHCTFAEDSFWPEVAPAIAKAADRFDRPADRAAAIGLLIRCVEFLPSCIVVRNRRADLNCMRKDSYAAGFDTLIDRFRAGLDAMPIERAGYAHALAHCSKADASDVVRLLDALAWDAEEEATASVALSVGVVASRVRRDLSSQVIARVRELRGLLDAESVLVKSCAAAGLLMFEGAPDATVTAAFCAGIADPVALPAAWGWGAPRRDTTEELLVPMAVWAPWTPAQARRLVDSLAGSTGWQVGEVLWRLEFGDGKAVPLGGVALEELTRTQRIAVEHMATRNAATRKQLRALGFWWTEVEIPAFLAGTQPRWRPLDVHTHDGPRRWHFCRIWRGHILEQVSLDATMSAFFDNFDATDLLRMVVDRKHRLLMTLSTQSDPDTYRRDARLLTAVLDRLLEDGHDVPGQLRPLASAFRPNWDVDALAMSFALLMAHARTETVPAQNRDEIFAWGMNRAGMQSCDEQLAAMLEPLGPERVALIRSNHYFR